MRKKSTFDVKVPIVPVGLTYFSCKCHIYLAQEISSRSSSTTTAPESGATASA